MRTSFLLASLLALPLLGAAQTDLATDSRTGTLNDRYALGYFMTPRDGVVAQGSVFLLPAWTAGTLLLNGSAKALAGPLKYDVYNQEVRMRQTGGDSVAVAVARLSTFSLGARRFACYPPASLPSEVGGGCGEVLYDGPVVQLLKYERKTLEKKAAAGGGYASSSTEPMLERHTHYYLRWTADGRFTDLKPRRSSLEQALTGQPAAVAALKARKGSISTDAELAAALAAVAPQLMAPVR